MKNILLFSNAYPYGTQEGFLGQEVKALAREFDVTILPLSAPGDSPPREVPANVRIFDPVFPYSLKDRMHLAIKGALNRAPLKGLAGEFIGNRAWRSKGRLVAFLGGTMIRRMVSSALQKREFREEAGRFDILYFYWGDHAAYAVPLIREHTEAKILVRFHGSDLYEEAGQGYIPFRSQVLNSLDAALFVSDHGRNYLRSKYPGIGFRAETFRLGVADHGTAPFSPSDKLRILTCSNMVALKRLPLLADALKHTGFPVVWTHLGDGPEREAIMRLATELPPQVESRFPGHLDHDSLMRFYLENPVDLFINVSRSEGLPVTIMEALSFGIPVIATNAGGTSELVDDTCGKLLPVEISAEDLGLAIGEFRKLTGKELLRRNARVRFEEKCNAERNMASFAAFLHKITEEL